MFDGGIPAWVRGNRPALILGFRKIVGNFFVVKIFTSKNAKLGDKKPF